MPGPAVYVAVAVGTVAAVIVFKQFVYDPHLRPTFSAWKDDLVARRRERQRRRQQRNAPQANVPVSSSSTTSEDEDSHGKPIILNGRRFQKRTTSFDSGDELTSTIELEPLVASEIDDWKSITSEVGVDQPAIRLRRLRTSQSHRSPSLMDENESSLISQPPLQPSGPKVQRGSVLFEAPGSPPVQAPASVQVQASLQSQQQSSVLGSSQVGDISSEARKPSQPSGLPAFAIPSGETPGSPSLPTPVSLASATPPTHAISRTSTPDTDLLTASMMTSGDHFFTPEAATRALPGQGTSSPALSPAPSSLNISAEIVSTLSSHPGSPFSDMSDTLRRAGPAESVPSDPSDRILSPPIVIRDVSSDTEFHSVVGEDDDTFSLTSPLSSNVGSDEDDFENVSVLGSEASSWGGMDAH